MWRSKNASEDSLSCVEKKAICLIVFSIYILVLLYITIFRFDFFYEERQLNLTLFVNLITIYRNEGVGRFVWLLVGNIAWFVPFGFLLPILSTRKNLFAVVAGGFLLSLFIESIQFIFYKGVAELDDLILNVLGVVIGYIFYKMMSRLLL